jgi:tetratricopeptide (TPR) repeat protein
MEADAWRALAYALIPQRRLPEAGIAVEKAFELDQHQFGNDGLKVGVDLTYEARVDMEMGRLQPALEQIDAALGNLAKSAPSEGPDRNDALLQKAAILNRLGRHQDALKLLVPLVALLRTGGSEYEDHDRLSRGLVELGRAQAGNGDIPHALASWDEAMTLQQALQSPDPDEIADLQGLLAQARAISRIPKKSGNG